MVGDLHSQQIPVQQASLGCGGATDSHYECAADKSGLTLQAIIQHASFMQALALCFEMLSKIHTHSYSNGCIEEQLGILPKDTRRLANLPVSR